MPPHPIHPMLSPQKHPPAYHHHRNHPSPGDSWKASNSREAEASPAYSLFFNVSPRGEQVGGPTADQKKTSWWPRAHGSPLILPIRLSVFDWKKKLLAILVSCEPRVDVSYSSGIVLRGVCALFVVYVTVKKKCLNGKLVNKNSLHKITKQTRIVSKRSQTTPKALPYSYLFKQIQKIIYHFLNKNTLQTLFWSKCLTQQTNKQTNKQTIKQP